MFRQGPQASRFKRMRTCYNKSVLGNETLIITERQDATVWATEKPPWMGGDIRDRAPLSLRIPFIHTRLWLACAAERSQAL